MILQPVAQEAAEALRRGLCLVAGQLRGLGVGDLLQMEKATGREVCPGWENYEWVGAG